MVPTPAFPSPFRCPSSRRKSPDCWGCANDECLSKADHSFCSFVWPGSLRAPGWLKSSKFIHFSFESLTENGSAEKTHFTDSEIDENFVKYVPDRKDDLYNIPSIVKVALYLMALKEKLDRIETNLKLSDENALIIDEAVENLFMIKEDELRPIAVMLRDTEAE